jgi:hypothetical protein
VPQLRQAKHCSGDPVQHRSEGQQKSRCLTAGTAADSFHGAVGEEKTNGTDGKPPPPISGC